MSRVCSCGRGQVWARGLCNTCYKRHRTRMRAYGRWDPEQLVSAVGSTRKLQSLAAIGYRVCDLSIGIGCSHPRSTVPALMCGDMRQVRASTACRIDEMWRRLQMTPGPSRLARRRAEAKKWAPPLAWDPDRIDDPAAEPGYYPYKPVPNPFVESYTELRDSGLSDGEIAEFMGIKSKSLARQKQRHLKEAS